MQLVLDSSDMARLSVAARGEILRLLSGEAPAAAATAAGAARRNFRWRQPHDVGLPLLRKLLKGADGATRDRLAVLARNNGRASMTQLLAVTNQSVSACLPPSLQ